MFSECTNQVQLWEGLSEDMTMRFDMLSRFAQLAAVGEFEVPVARVFALEDRRAAHELSKGQHARGRVMLLLKGELATPGKILFRCACVLFLSTCLL